MTLVVLGVVTKCRFAERQDLFSRSQDLATAIEAVTTTSELGYSGSSALDGVYQAISDVR